MNATSDVAEAKASWMQFAVHVVASMAAGDKMVAAYRNGDLAGARMQTRIALERAEAIVTLARTLRAQDAKWAPVCDCMLRAGKMQADGYRRMPWPTGAKTFREIGVAWSVAALEMRTLLAELGGDPNDAKSFVEMVK
jgi:hypothetical protein